MNTAEEKMGFRGDKLRVIREASGMTLDQVASRMHRVRATVSLWELGKSAPPMHVLSDLAKMFNVSPGFFFED